MSKKIEMQGYNRYYLRTNNETDIFSYELVDRKKHKVAKIRNVAKAISLINDNGEKILIPSQEIIWKFVPLFIEQKNRIKSYIPVRGYENEFSIDLETQRIWSKNHNKFLKIINNKGVLSIRLKRNGKVKACALGNIIWQSVYKEDVDSTKDEIRHLDANPSNNAPENLMKLPISVNRSIKMRYTILIRGMGDPHTTINNMYNDLMSYNIKHWKKQRLEAEFNKFIKSLSI